VTPPFNLLVQDTGFREIAEFADETRRLVG
jgi:hypothetical protein